MKSGPYTKVVPIHFSYEPLTVREYNTIGVNPPGNLVIANSAVNFNSWKVKTGVYNPQWKASKGKVVVNSPYSLDYQTADIQLGDNIVGYKTDAYYDYWGRRIQYTTFHVVRGFPYPSDSGWSDLSSTVNLSEADNLAKLDLAKRITNEYRKFSGGTVMWELRESLAMIRKPGKALWKGVEKYLTEVPKRVKNVKVPKSYKGFQRELRLNKEKQRVLRETWLEMSFGWQPLISDIKDIAEAAAEFGLTAERENEGLRTIRSKRFQGKKAVSETAIQRIADNSWGFNLTYYEKVKRSQEAWVMYAAQCRREILYPKNELQKLVQLSGFSLREWVPTIWNCIPYSFLVDYFTNIGDVAEFYATDLSSVAGMTKTTRRDISYIMRNEVQLGVSPNTANNWSGDNNLGVLTMSRVLFDRVLIDPQLNFDVKFQLENPLPSPKKLFNMAALALGFRDAKLSLAR